VTGASGHLGTALVELLASSGLDVIAIDIRHPEKSAEAEDDAEDAGRVTRVTASVTDLAAMTAALAGADTVFHCCSLIDLCPFPVKALVQVNVGGTQVRMCEEERR
jgi:nucleoside-diphosphate-sugar epimerase